MAAEFIGRSWLAELGYKDICTNPMAEQVETWWGWYTATNDFYAKDTYASGRHFKVRRITTRPAEMVCEDMASFLFNERTAIGITGDDEPGITEASDWLKQWVESVNLVEVANRSIERTMALGTGAWALGVADINEDGTANTDTRITLSRFDARYITPLDYDEDSCTACLFRSMSVIDGKRLHQLQVYRKGESGTYEIHTAFFNNSRQQVAPEGYTTYFDTGSKTQPFALFRPALQNNYLEFHPFGVSLFDRALGAVRLVDLAADNLNRDIYLGQKMVFLPAGMLEHDEDKNVVIPRAQDQQVFVAFDDNNVTGDGQKPYEYNPDLRVEENRLALKTALEMLGQRVGFGEDYYGLDERGNIRARTATEVSSDNSVLMRTIHRHEGAIRPAVETICTAAVEMAAGIYGRPFPDVTGRIQIDFGDSIIEDDSAVRARDRADVAAGLMPGWKYIETWQAVPEEEAREIYADAQGLSLGNELMP